MPALCLMGAALACGCVGPRREPSRPDDAVAIAESTPAPSGTHDAREGAASAAPPPANPPVRSYERAAHYPPEGRVVVKEWLSASGIGARFAETTCWDAGGRVGVPPAAGLFCESETTRPPKKTFRLFRKEGGALRLVWEGIVGSWANWLELTPLIENEGASLTVHDRGPHECDAALCQYAEKERHGIRADFGDVLSRGCAGLGTYRWNGRKYVQVPIEESSRDDYDCSDELP